MNKLSDLIPKDWREQLLSTKTIELLNQLDQFLISQKNKTIYPERNNIFNALKLTSFENLKVVILGQDPYHGAGQSHGLAFSVQDGCPFPPSLKNIFKELESDMSVQIPMSGNLSHWAKQGVLLLNTVLTVEESKANSHQKKGWEEFTDLIIQTISQNKKEVVFVLWGKPAQKKITLIDQTKHLILQSVHPSPLSAYRGFFGSQPFSTINAYLDDHSIDEIDWSL